MMMMMMMNNIALNSMLNLAINIKDWINWLNVEIGK